MSRKATLLLPVQRPSVGFPMAFVQFVSEKIRFPAVDHRGKKCANYIPMSHLYEAADPI